MKRHYGSLGSEDRRKKIWEEAKKKGQLYRCVDCGTYYRTNPDINDGCPDCGSSNVFHAGDIRYKSWKNWRG